MELALQAAYQSCHKLARAHYENFPVASILLPKKLRRAVCAVYAFARTADDFADEEVRSCAQRLAALNNLQSQLDYIAQNCWDKLDQNMLALADTIQVYNLPINLFSDLLQAFRQDVSKQRYTNFAEVLDYAQHSANPIGRILLHLNSNARTPNNTAPNLILADYICSALQFINILQDFTLDLLNRNRLYLPQDDLEKFNLNPDNLLQPEQQENLQQYLKYACQQARELLDHGQSLPASIASKLFALELKMIITSAYTILDKIDNNTNIYRRVKLNKFDVCKIFCKVLFNG